MNEGKLVAESGTLKLELSLFSDQNPVSLLFSIPWIAAAALMGSIAGRLATGAPDAISSALAGAAFSVPLSLSYSVLLVSLAEEQEVHTSIRVLLYADSIGAVTG